MLNSISLIRVLFHKPSQNGIIPYLLYKAHIQILQLWKLGLSAYIFPFKTHLHSIEIILQV